MQQQVLEAENPSPAHAKRRVFYIDVIRSCACFLVVSSHIFAPICAGMNDFPRSVWWGFNLFDSIIRPSAAMYLMISGKIFLGSRREEPFVQFVWKRYAKILAPFFVWSMIYAYHASYALETPFSPGRAVLDFLHGPTAYHLWFMYVILGLYWVMPAMRRVVRSATPLGLSLLLGLWMGFLLFEFAFPQFDGFHALTLLLSYGGYVMLGYALDKTTLHKRTGLWMGVWGAVVLFDAVQTYLLTMQNGGILNEKFYFGAAPLVAVQAAAMFLLLKNIDEQSFVFKTSWLRRSVTRLGQHSYNVYLNHALVIWLLISGSLGFTLSEKTGSNPWIGVSLTTATVLALSLGLSVFLQKIPLISKLLVISPPSAQKPSDPELPPLSSPFPETSQI